jgi:uncharacterized protein (DUF885 family)
LRAGAPATEAEANGAARFDRRESARPVARKRDSLGIDKGARARAALTSSATAAQAGQQRFAATLRADLARAEARSTFQRPHPFDADQRRGRAQRLSHRARRLRLPYGDVAVGGWRNTPYVVIQNVGAYLDTPRFLDTDHPIENAADAEAYLAGSHPIRAARRRARRMRAARAQGPVPPAFLIDKAIKQLRSRPRRARGRRAGRIDRAPHQERASRAIGPAARARHRPAEGRAGARRQIAELRAARRGDDDAGMWARPHGDEYYRWALKASTTTDMTPDEVHQMGLEQLRELHGADGPDPQELGYTKGSVGERMQALAKDPRYKFAEGDKGRAEIMAFIQERLKIIRAQLPRAFNTLVRGNLEVKRLPPEEEPGAPGAYGGAGSIDGKIPGKFWINLRTTDLHSKYSLPDLAHHEAIPGHVWQGEYANKLPLIRTLLAFNAYSEGWALYAEQLADELGVYDDFPVGRLGYLQSIAFRACRLVVDTGLHAKRWTREQGVASSSTSTARTRWKWRARSTAIAAGRARPAATRSATARSTASATAPRRRSGPLRPARSTTPCARRQRADGRARQERRRYITPSSTCSANCGEILDEQVDQLGRGAVIFVLVGPGRAGRGSRCRRPAPRPALRSRSSGPCGTRRC